MVVELRYPPRLNAYAIDPPLVTQLPKEVAGSDTEATGDYLRALHASARLVGGSSGE
jgi:hypothetical protein